MIPQQEGVRHEAILIDPNDSPYDRLFHVALRLFKRGEFRSRSRNGFSTPKSYRLVTGGNGFTLSKSDAEPFSNRQSQPCCQSQLDSCSHCSVNRSDCYGQADREARSGVKRGFQQKVGFLVLYEEEKRRGSRLPA